MAAACLATCDICMHEFNKVDRNSVALPCGHDFCLTCLVRLKTSGSHKCPKCRGDWEEVEVEALPGMMVNIDDKIEEEFTTGTRKKGDGLCEKHQLSYVFWYPKDKEFLCNKCIVEMSSCSKLELIDDAIPQIKTDLTERVAVAAAQIKKDSAELEKMNEELYEKISKVLLFKEKIEELERGIRECIKRIKSLKGADLNSSFVREELEGIIRKINSDLDICTIVDSRATLEQLSEPIELPSVEESKSLLCNIVCSYEQASWPDNYPSEDIFVRELLKALKGSVDPQNETRKPDDPPSVAALMSGLLRAPERSTELIASIGRGAKELKGGKMWTVNSSNCLVTLLTLADRQPSVLTLIARPDEHEALPAAAVAAVAKAARDCEVRVRFLDSFFNPQDVNTDLKRLEHFVGNSSLHLRVFYGHLNAAGIAKLPHTIDALGLAIGSAADARDVSGLRSWEGLRCLYVSVSCGVAAQDLRPLPSVTHTCMFFPGLTDARVDSVRPAIEALVGDRGLHCLCLPLSQLTAGSASLLAQQLRGVEIQFVYIEASGPWRPGTKEKKSVATEFRNAGRCCVEWDMDWLYR